MSAQFKLPPTPKPGPRFWTVVTRMQLDPEPETHRYLWICFVLVMLTEASFWLVVTFLLCRFLG